MEQSGRVVKLTTVRGLITRGVVPPLPHSMTRCLIKHRNDSTGTFIKINVVDTGGRTVCGRSLAGIEGSNPADGMNVCLFVECCVLLQAEASATEPITRPGECHRV